MLIQELICLHLWPAWGTIAVLKQTRFFLHDFTFFFYFFLLSVDPSSEKHSKSFFVKGRCNTKQINIKWGSITTDCRKLV